MIPVMRAPARLLARVASLRCYGYVRSLSRQPGPLVTAPRGTSAPCGRARGARLFTHLHAVTEGALSVVVNGNPVHRLSTWGTFGEMALVDTDYVNRATVVVESQTARLLRLDRAAFFEVMESFEVGIPYTMCSICL